MDKLYGIAEIFCSVQGEGVRSGTLNHFIRFAGCNLDCKVATGYGFNCDTDFRLRERLTVQQIAARCKVQNPNCNWCVLTGGEPAAQLDVEFIHGMHNLGYRLAIETNGTIELPRICDSRDAYNLDCYPLDWITVSPKNGPLAIEQRYADEVKYVVAAGQPLPESTVTARYRCVSPAFSGPALDKVAVDWCLKLVHENPEWRLSLQTHKWILVR